MQVQNFKFYETPTQTQSNEASVLKGLKAKRKSLPCHLLYDERGSQLFEKICEQEEYYLSRTELELLKKHAPEITKHLGTSPLIFEFGAGNAQKVRPLLGYLREGSSYLAIDISKEHLIHHSEQLAKEFPDIGVFAVCADFTKKPDLPRELEGRAEKVFFFPGSTIGNMAPHEAVKLMKEIRSLVGPRGAALIGVDLKKDPKILHHAYNDAEGFTSAFELNILRRLNEEMGANFDLEGFQYMGTYNQKEGKVEMYLVSKRPQAVNLLESEIRFKKGEKIHIENSYKYSVSEFHDLAQQAGFFKISTWLDDKNWFSMNLLLPH